MAQSPAPRPNPGLPDKFIVSSQNSRDGLIVCLIALIFFMLIFMVLLLGMLGSDSDPGLFLIIPLMLAPAVAYFVWLIGKEQRTRTVVDGNGLLLEQPGMSTLFIPWQNAHGRITIKTVSQYVPGTSTPAMMSTILVAFDQEQIVLPGSLLNSHPYSSRDIAQQTYATAMQILAYDPWGQSEPLIQSENTFTPYMPQNMYASQNYMLQNMYRSQRGLFG